MNNWQMIIQFPDSRDSRQIKWMKRMVHLGLIRIWHPEKRQIWYRFVINEEILEKCSQYLNELKTWSELDVFINRHKVPKETLWNLICYTKADSLYRPCQLERKMDQMIGCPQGFLSIEAYHPQAWYTKLKHKAEGSVVCFKLSESSWTEHLRNRLGGFFYCPALEAIGNLSWLNRLPRVLYLKDDLEHIFSIDRNALRVQNKDLYDKWLAGILWNDQTSILDS